MYYISKKYFIQQNIEFYILHMYNINIIFFYRNLYEYAIPWLYRSINNSFYNYGRNAMKRPYVVEILGTPESGKTTAIKDMITSLSQKGYRIYYVRESAEETPKEFKKGSLEEHFWMHLNTARNIIYAKQCDVDIVLIDRGFWDTLFWNDIFYQKGGLSWRKLQVMDEFYKSIQISPELTFVLTTEVEEVISRRGGEGRIVTRNFIKEYNNELIQFLEKIFPPPVVIDTTGQTQSEVTKYIENIILQRYKERV